MRSENDGINYWRHFEGYLQLRSRPLYRAADGVGSLPWPSNRHASGQMVGGADRPRYEASVAFCREGRCPKGADLLRVWAHLWVDHLSPRQLQAAHELWLLLDDTLFHKTGRKVEGAGHYRDAVRSGVKTVTAWATPKHKVV